MTDAQDRLETLVDGHIEKHALEQTATDRERIGHEKQHASEALAVTAAVESERQRLIQHQVTHSAAHAAHEELHHNAVEVHEKQHASEYRAVEAATGSMDKRLDQMNEFRDQLRDQAATFARKESVEALDAQAERRYEELRLSIQHEREERRATEGVKRGMNATTAIIVTAIGVMGTVLGIVVVVVNLLTAAP